MVRFRRMKKWAVIALIGGAASSAFGTDVHSQNFDACRRAANRSAADPSACFAAEFNRLDAHLQILLKRHERAFASDANANALLADHDRWQRAAIDYCAGVAATEPMPSYEAALLDCSVSVMADRVATLEDAQRSISGLFR